MWINCGQSYLPDRIVQGLLNQYAHEEVENNFMNSDLSFVNILFQQDFVTFRRIFAVSPRIKQIIWTGSEIKVQLQHLEQGL